MPSTAARNARPLEFGYFIQDLINGAESAGKRGDHVAESRFYRAFTLAVPDASVGYSKLCESLEAANRRDDAIAACRQALGREGASIKDYVRFVRLVLVQDNAALTPEEIEDVKQVTAHLREKPESRLAGSHLECELGVRTESIPLLTECTAALAAMAPDDPKTLAFQWALALRAGDSAGARRLVGRASARGLTKETVARMDRATVQLETAWRRRLYDWRALIAYAAAIACALLVYHVRRHRRSSSERVALEWRDGTAA